MDISTKQQFLFKHTTANGAEYKLTAIADSEEEARKMVREDLKEVLEALK